MAVPSSPTNVQQVLNSPKAQQLLEALKERVVQALVNGFKAKAQEGNVDLYTSSTIEATHLLESDIVKQCAEKVSSGVTSTFSGSNAAIISKIGEQAADSLQQSGVIDSFVKNNSQTIIESATKATYDIVSERTNTELLTTLQGMLDENAVSAAREALINKGKEYVGSKLLEPTFTNEIISTSASQLQSKVEEQVVKLGPTFLDSLKQTLNPNIQASLTQYLENNQANLFSTSEAQGFLATLTPEAKATFIKSIAQLRAQNVYNAFLNANQTVIQSETMNQFSKLIESSPVSLTESEIDHILNQAMKSIDGTQACLPTRFSEKLYAVLYSNLGPENMQFCQDLLGKAYTGLEYLPKLTGDFTETAVTSFGGSTEAGYAAGATAYYALWAVEAAMGCYATYQVAKGVKHGVKETAKQAGSLLTWGFDKLKSAIPSRKPSPSQSQPDVQVVPLDDKENEKEEQKGKNKKKIK